MIFVINIILRLNLFLTSYSKYSVLHNSLTLVYILCFELSYTVQFNNHGFNGLFFLCWPSLSMHITIIQHIIAVCAVDGMVLLLLANWQIIFPWAYYDFVVPAEFLCLLLRRCLLDGRKSIWPVKSFSDEVLASLSVWIEVKMTCVWSSWCHCMTSSLLQKNSELFLLLVPTYLGCPGK